jgi:cobalt-zinc-cadmium efflux system membrane fusion protein
MGALWLLQAGPGAIDDDGHADDHSDDHDQVPTGPHGGRLLRTEDFALELLIYERGVPPEFRGYAYHDDEPLAAEAFSMRVALERLEGTRDVEFVPAGDHQRGQGVVREPHSFDVTVRATFSGRDFQWHFESHEGRTSIPDDVAAATGVRTAMTGPATLEEVVRLTGSVEADPARLAAVTPRFAGIVRAVHAEVGQRVAAGDVLATVESNESLQPFDVLAPIDGLVLSRDVQVGRVVGSQPLYQIVDTSRVWVQLDVFGRDLARVRTGQPAAIETIDGARATGTIEWLSPLVTHGSQSIRGRVVLANPDGALRPGQFVTGEVVVDRHQVQLAVRREALQRFRDFDVVFARYGDTYEVRMLELGHGDREFVEVLDGISPGVEYVTANSYLIKADIEKAGASHDH